MRDVYILDKIKGRSNETVYGKFDMSSKAIELNVEYVETKNEYNFLTSFGLVVLLEVGQAGRRGEAWRRKPQSGRCNWKGTAECWDIVGCIQLAGCWPLHSCDVHCAHYLSIPLEPHSLPKQISMMENHLNISKI